MDRNGGAVVLSPHARQTLFAQPAFRHLGAAARTQAAAFFREVALGKDELAAYRTAGLRAFYVRPRKIARTLLAARSPRELKNYLRIGWEQLRQLRASASF